MSRVIYSDWMTLEQARDTYFRANQFGADGGYCERWVDFKLGPIPFPFPNTPARVRAVRYHDLHHVLTGYATDFLGETEISAWEIGAGCNGFFAAWQLSLAGLGGGILLAPRRTARAFFRGRHSRSLYGADYEALLSRAVGEVRRELGLEQNPEYVPSFGDRVYLVLAALTGIITVLLSLVIGLCLLPIGLLTLLARSSRASASSRSVE